VVVLELDGIVFCTMVIVDGTENKYKQRLLHLDLVRRPSLCCIAEQQNCIGAGYCTCGVGFS